MMDYFNGRRSTAQTRSSYRVCMQFHLQRGWQVQFMDEDLRTTLPRKLTFAFADKITEMFDRFAESRLLEDRQALQRGIEMGRGAIWLKLTAEQHARLTKPRG